MRAAVFSLGSTSSQWVVEELKQYFDVVDAIDIKNMEINFSGKKAEILYMGKPIDDYDCVYARGSFRYANLLNSLTIIMPNTVFMPINANSFQVAHDKLLTQLALQEYNIPMPRTYVAANPAAARSIFNQVQYPIILKFPHGTQGKGVLVAESYASASSIMDALSYLRQPFIIQEFIDAGGKDIRAIVIGNKVVASYQRIAAGDEIRANIHQGGRGEEIILDEQTKQLAIKAAKAVGTEISGVDLLMSPHKGPLVIEVNISPGLQGVTKYTGVNVAAKIAEHLYAKTKELKEVKHAVKAQDIMASIEQIDQDVTPIITNLDFRGTRILLPEIVCKGAGIKEEEDYEIRVKKDEVIIKRFSIS